jgi:hypothetical protein
MFNIDNAARVATGILGALFFATLSVSAAVGPGMMAGPEAPAAVQLAETGNGGLNG